MAWRLIFSIYFPYSVGKKTAADIIPGPFIFLTNTLPTGRQVTAYMKKL